MYAQIPVRLDTPRRSTVEADRLYTVDVFTDNTGTNAKVSPNLICNSTRYVIRNMAELDAYKNKPYVTGFPHMRSYLEVPLKTSKGRVIGGLCVIDNNVRDEFKSDESVFVLNEIASSIMDYLELVTVRHNHDRGERLMEGLSLFAEGRESFTVHTAPGANEAPSSAAQPRNENESGTGSSFDLGESLESHRSEISSNHDVACPQSSFPSLDLSDDGPLMSDVDIQTDQQTPLTSPSSGTTFDASHEMSLITSKYSATFSRAANLIREAMDMEGLAFLDGDDFISDQSKSLRSSTTRGQSDAGGSIEEDEEPPADEYSPLCTTMGCSLAPVEDKGGLTFPLALHQHTLRRMVNMYPRGCVFSVDRDGIVTSSVADGEQSPAKSAKRTKGSSPRSQTIPVELQSLLSATRTAIFLPLWDVRKGQFFAGLLGWTRDPTRVFEKEDLTCFSAFGDSLMTELGRLEAVEFSRAKSNFISSVSHELRSPLHGILAGAELLRDAIKDESQSEMVRIIETCGTTLLDTLNHLLDFAKINNLDDPKVLVQKSITPADQQPDAVNENPIQDLGELMQDVVEGVYFGYVSKAAAHRRPRATQTRSMPESEQLGDTWGTLQRHPKDPEDTHVAVFVNVEQGTDWHMPLQVGAWKRIVMNTFSNALKYTRCGQVELCLKKIITTDPSNSTRRYAKFTVKDTGIGMGPDYLKHQLFKPFAQENPIADGTGLGLSIVKQIVDNLGGTIDIQSTTGIGTRIEVIVPIPLYSLSDSVARPVSRRITEGIEKLQGRTVCLVSFDQPKLEEIPARAFNAESKNLSTMAALLTQLASTHFGMEVISAQSLDVAADFYVVDTSFIVSNLDQKTCQGKRILSFGSEFFNNHGGLATGSPVTHIKYPIGPRNLGKALVAANNTYHEDAKVISATNRETVAEVMPFHDNAVNGGVVISPPIIGQGSNDTSKKSSLESKKHLLLVDDNAINLKVL